VFVFHEPLLAGLRLSGKRLIFRPRRLPSSTARCCWAIPSSSWPAAAWPRFSLPTLGCVELVHSRFPLGGFLLQIAGQIGTSRAGCG